ncbi:hypothetical protein SLEP1_g58314 [Rubroshorea leprosula]|nr:hypothetical protein SLEP1_g58314 [Rubroshorea leprosula]
MEQACELGTPFRDLHRLDKELKLKESFAHASPSAFAKISFLVTGQSENCSACLLSGERLKSWLTKRDRDKAFLASLFRLLNALLGSSLGTSCALALRQKAKARKTQRKGPKDSPLGMWILFNMSLILKRDEKNSQQPEMLEGAKSIGAGAATIASAGAAVGIGNVFSSLIHSVARNPSLAKQLFGYAILGFALTEAIALFALMMAFLILFVF